MTSPDLPYTVERFLYREVRLPAEGRFEEWLDLFTDDARYLMAYQSRLERTEKSFVGRREDRLRTGNGGYRIAGRKVVLDQSLPPRSLTIFFQGWLPVRFPEGDQLDRVRGVEAAEGTGGV